jgi:hypothetical protein
MRKIVLTAFVASAALVTGATVAPSTAGANTGPRYLRCHHAPHHQLVCPGLPSWHGPVLR